VRVWRRRPRRDCAAAAARRDGCVGGVTGLVWWGSPVRRRLGATGRGCHTGCAHSGGRAGWQRGRAAAAGLPNRDPGGRAQDGVAGLARRSQRTVRERCWCVPQLPLGTRCDRARADARTGPRDSAAGKPAGGPRAGFVGLGGQRLEALAQLLLEACEVGGDDLQKALGGRRGGLRALAVGQVLRGQAQHVRQLAEERPAAL